MPQHEDTIPESSYPSLTAPQFQSQIPEYLLEGASKQDKHIMAQLSKLTQFSEWSIRAHISTMESVRKTNGRLLRAEGDIADFKGDRTSVQIGWKVIAKAVGLITAVVGFALAAYQALKPQ